ncbi:MAG: phosphate signaling complex protein PhoU [Chloroflexi bacterium]|nr:phosphate signaling complex protein PhoU [Chloroflexota bacterium]
MQTSPKRHTDREYEAELQQVRERLLVMGGRVEEMIGNALRAVGERDAGLARATIDLDHKVNRAEMEVDELCLRILARRQPMASDLRFLTLALKMVTDLERIGDLAVNICERAIDLRAETRLEGLDKLEKMAAVAQGMVRDAIDAFVHSDADRAQQVIDRDDEVDELYHAYFRDVLAVMVVGSDNVERGIHVQSVAKWLERIGDHATNLAEIVIFMVKGKDVRHAGKLDL